MTYPYSPNQILLMDGAAGITDLISGAAFSMAGTPATATVLGATAPTIAAGSYSSCSIATPFAAGSALTVLIALTTAWAGNDGVAHRLWNTGGDWNAANSLSIDKNTGNYLQAFYTDASANLRRTQGPVTWTAGTHIIIATFAAAGNIALYVDGTAITTSVQGAATREASVDSTTYIGTRSTGASITTASMLCAFWSRVLTATEITALSSLTAWSSLTTPVATGSGRIGTGGNRLSHARYLGA